MSSKLARRFQVDVSTDAVTWIPYKGIQDFAKKESPTIQSTTDFDAGGFETVEKTVTSATVTIKNRHIDILLVEDPGQALTRIAGEFQFQDASRLYIRWYDRFNPAETGWQMRAVVDWSGSKTAVSDVEEITAVFRGDGVVSSIANPLASAVIPVITAVTPSGVAAAGIIRIVGAHFTTPVATTGVKVGGVNATSWDFISDSLIEAVVPAGSAGSAPIIVTTTAGASAGFAYTRS
jgi:hypothetical protein